MHFAVKNYSSAIIYGFDPGRFALSAMRFAVCWSAVKFLLLVVAARKSSLSPYMGMQRGWGRRVSLSESSVLSTRYSVLIC